MRRRRDHSVVEGSFLRAVDPRTKLLLSLSASAAVMLPLPQLTVFCACYVVFLAAAGIGGYAAAHVMRIRLLLCVLFAVDWLFIGFGFAVLITLRMALLVSGFSLVLATTTADELRCGLERWRLPQRVAFTFSTAYCSLGLLEAEWSGIVEAQRARGIFAAPSGTGWRHWRRQLGDAVSLVVPAIVLVTQRAWALNEAAAMRGFESPQRRSFHVARLAALDFILLAGVAALLVGLFAWG